MIDGEKLADMVGNDILERGEINVRISKLELDYTMIICIIMVSILAVFILFKVFYSLSSAFVSTVLFLFIISQLVLHSIKLNYQNKLRDQFFEMDKMMLIEIMEIRKDMESGNDASG